VGWESHAGRLCTYCEGRERKPSCARGSERLNHTRRGVNRVTEIVEHVRGVELSCRVQRGVVGLLRGNFAKLFLFISHSHGFQSICPCDNSCPANNAAILLDILGNLDFCPQPLYLACGNISCCEVVLCRVREAKNKVTYLTLACCSKQN